MLVEMTKQGLAEPDWKMSYTVDINEPITITVRFKPFGMVQVEENIL